MTPSHRNIAIKPGAKDVHAANGDPQRGWCVSYKENGLYQAAAWALDRRMTWALAPPPTTARAENAARKDHV